MPSGVKRASVPLARAVVPYRGGADLPVVWCDPGATSGYCVISVPADTMYPDRHGKLAPYRGIKIHEYSQHGRQEEGELSEREHADILIALAQEIAAKCDYKVPVGTESFGLRKFSGSTDLLYPVRIIEHIKAAHREWTGLSSEQAFAADGAISTRGGLGDDSIVSQLFQQNASTAKTNVTDARLERWGLYVSAPTLAKQGAHARDALRHCVAFVRRCAERESMRDLAWGAP